MSATHASASQILEQMIKLEDRILNASGEEKSKLEAELELLEKSVEPKPKITSAVPSIKKKKSKIRTM